MINYDELYSMDDFISDEIFRDDYVLNMQSANSRGLSCEEYRMVSKDYKYILKVFEEQILERWGTDSSPPYEIKSYNWAFSDYNENLRFWSTEITDSYFSITILNVRGNEEMINGFKEIKAKFI
jgi:hypothetical protein